MDDSEDEDGNMLTNFLYGNVDKKGKLEDANYIPEVGGAELQRSASEFSRQPDKLTTGLLLQDAQDNLAQVDGPRTSRAGDLFEVSVTARMLASDRALSFSGSQD